MCANKKLIFITFTINCGYVGPTLSPAYLAPVAYKHLYEVVALNVPFEIGGEYFRKKVLSLSPSIVGFSCTTNQFKYLIKYSRELEQFKDILQICGGAHSTLNPDEVLLKSAVNGACVGEGEKPLDNLLRNIEQKKDIFSTEGFYWKNNGKIIKNSIPQFINDLSILPFPDYSVLDKDLVINEMYNDDFTTWKQLHCMLGRGCPNACNYCCNNALSSIYSSSQGYWRLPSVEYSIDHLKQLVKQFPEVDCILFQDNLALGKSEWIKSFLKIYKDKISLPYRMLARPEGITFEIAKLLKDSGCDVLIFGLESGNEDFRRRMLNRQYSNEFFIKTIKMIKSVGIKVTTYNIVGFPNETKRILKDTFILNKNISPYDGICSFFYPYKGTVLYDFCKKHNLLFDEKDYYKITNYNTKPAIKLNMIIWIRSIYYQKLLTSFFIFQRLKYILFYTYRQHKGWKRIISLFFMTKFFYKGLGHVHRTFRGSFLPKNKRSRMKLWKEEWI